jgi:hypothetical protein
MTHSTTTRTPSAATRRQPRVATWLITAGFAITAWLAGTDVSDDRGSESAEKAFMVILAITLGTAVSAAAVAYVATKTALFK